MGLSANCDTACIELILYQILASKWASIVFLIVNTHPKTRINIS